MIKRHMIKPGQIRGAQAFRQTKLLQITTQTGGLQPEKINDLLRIAHVSAKVQSLPQKQGYSMPPGEGYKDL